ncbi:hypothetical protein Tco_0031551, partial [Tanacetum coccineum]
MSSRVSNNDVHIEGEHRKQKPFLKSNDLQCPTCKKCPYSANHDDCILKYISKFNSRVYAQKKDAKSHKTTNRYMPIEKTSESKKHDRQIPIGQKFSPNKYSAVYLKTTPPRSDLTWKSTSRIFSNVRLRWIPTRKLFNSCTGKVDSEPTHGSDVDIPHIHACKQTLDKSAGTSLVGEQKQRIDLCEGTLFNVKQENLRVCSGLAPKYQMTFEHNSSSLNPQCQMNSDHNSSELGIHDHNNEPYSSKLVPTVIPPADKT